MIKAVLTAAGMGTRMLPMTKETPKEMLPVFLKTKNNYVILPMLQLIYEQLYDLKIRNYCFVVGREKRTIKNHFTSNVNTQLAQKNNSLINKFCKKLENSNLGWVNQSKPYGFGDAVRQSEKFVGKDNFLVHGGDVAILSNGKKNQSLKTLIKLGNNSTASAILLFRKVSDPKRHGAIKPYETVIDVGTISSYKAALKTTFH